MPTNFPTSVDAFVNPVSNDSLNSPSHSTQHANANDAIEAIEGYLLGRLRIKQIVSGSTVTEVSSSSTTYTDTTLTATITPSSATSKIIVIYQQGSIRKSAGNSNSAIDLKLVRNSTDLAFHYGLYTNSALELRVSGFGGIVYDEPASTSALTYKTQFRNGLAVDGVTVQIQNSRGSIILIEVEV